MKQKKVAFNREYKTFTGTYKGRPVSVMSTGMGCPSTAIGVEELANIGVKTNGSTWNFWSYAGADKSWRFSNSQMVP